MKYRVFAITSLILLTGCSQRAAQADAHSGTEPAKTNGCCEARSETDGWRAPAFVDGVERLSYISPRIYGIRESYDACERDARARGMPQDIEECAYIEDEYQQVRLDRAYTALRAEMRDPRHEVPGDESLVKSQSAWVGFHEANCGAKSLRYGSRHGPANLAQCLMSGTAARAQELEDWLLSTAELPGAVRL